MSRTAKPVAGPDVEVTLDARCTLHVADVSKACRQAIIAEFTHANSVYQKLLRMGYSTRGEKPKIRNVWEFPERGVMQVPRGGAPRLRAVMESHGYRVRWVDRRLTLPPVDFSASTLTLRPNQDPASHALVKKQQGILRGQTGTGKTETLLATAVKLGQPTLVIVWNKDLQKQWFQRILKYGVATKDELGGLGGIVKRPRHGKVAVAMQQSLVKHARKWARHYGTVILDEAHRAPARTFAEVVNQFPAKYRFGATADEKRGDGFETITYDTFGPVVAEIATAGTIHEPTLHYVHTAYQDPTYEEDKQFTALVNRLIVDKARNRLIRKHLRSRLKAGRRVVLFTERVEAAYLWVQLVEEMGFVAGPLVGGGDERVAHTIKGLKAGTCQFAAATTYADVGLDIPILDCAFITCPTGRNLKRINQQIGRVVREAKGKRDAEVWYFADTLIDGIDRAAKKVKRRWKKCIEHKREGDA